MRPQPAVLLAALAVAASPAYAGGELLFGSTARTLTSDTWDPYRSNNDLARVTALGGVDIGDNFTLGAGWAYGQFGRVNTVGPDQTVRAAFSANEVWLSGRASFEATKWLIPGFTVEALGTIGTTWLDSDASTRSNTNQLRETAFSPGVRAFGGVDLRIPQGSAPFTFGLRIDLGWTASTPLVYEHTTLRHGSGFTARTMIGVFF